MLAGEVKRGGVLKRCNTVDSHGGGLGDVLQLYNFYPLLNGHLDNFRPHSTQTSSISVTIHLSFIERITRCYISVALSPPLLLCVTLCVSTF